MGVGPAGHLAVAQAEGGIARLGQVGQGGQVGHNLHTEQGHLLAGHQGVHQDVYQVVVVEVGHVGHLYI